jgi:hypothetical protein
MARKGWSVDGFINRTHPTRGIQRAIAGRPEIPALDATHTTAYVRAAIGDQSGPWAQISAGSLRFKGDEVVTTVGDDGVSETDTVSLAISEAQYNLSAGLTRGPARLEVRDRLRAIGGNTYNSISARLDVALPWTLVSGFAESDGFRRSTNADVGVRFQPLPFVSVSGSIAQTTARSGSGYPSSRAARGEVGLKIFRPWISFGAMTVDNALVTAPIVYDTAFQPIALGRSNGIVGSIRGPIARGFGIDAYVTRWESQVPYRPQFQSRSELNFASTFPRRFPSGNFELRFAGVYEYRGGNLLPLRTTDIEVLAAKTVSALLEIRIMRAVISYQQRNILAYPYEIIPGFEMPRVLAIYGVRWEFWN